MTNQRKTDVQNFLLRLSLDNLINGLLKRVIPFFFFLIIRWLSSSSSGNNKQDGTVLGFKAQQNPRFLPHDIRL